MKTISLESVKDVDELGRYLQEVVPDAENIHQSWFDALRITIEEKFGDDGVDTLRVHMRTIQSAMQ